MKIYVDELGSDWVSGLLDPALPHRIYIAGITGVEVAAAIFRRARGGRLSQNDATSAVARLKLDLGTTYRILELTSALTDEAMRLAALFGLRGYDCIQLSSALFVQRQLLAAGLGPLTIVSSDLELNAAARAERFAVEDPNDHP